METVISASILLAQFEGYGDMSLYFWGALVLAVSMLIWDTVEVGRNDAANIVNAVFGARVLTRKWAVRVAGMGIVAGATMGSGVIETARKGIFDPTTFTFEQAVAIYVSVYVIDTILLYAYSAFGMPVSTTATLVCSLLGAALSFNAASVYWGKVGEVFLAIVVSIFLTGVMGFMLQRAVRGAIRDKWSSHPMLLQHGGWVVGGMLAALTYFMLVKGMKQLSFVKALQEDYLAAYGALLIIAALWCAYAVVVHALLVTLGRPVARHLFPVVAVIGMICMAFAFGQNDLANCATPGLAVMKLIDVMNKGGTVADGTTASIRHLALFGCGILLVLGTMTENAQRVTRAEVRMGSQGDRVKLYAPNWCIAVADAVLRLRPDRRRPSLAPAFTKTPYGKTMHYDPLRACVIMSVSACVIATASGLKLPVSTTYVAFAAVVATGMADRIFVRGDASLKLGRAIWVVFSWFAAAIIAIVASGVVCRLIYHLGVAGMIVGVAANLAVRRIVRYRSDRQEERVRLQAAERMHPEDYALEEEG